MKKLLIACLAFLLFVAFLPSHASAQLKRFSIGPYGEVAWPTGDFSNSNSTGLGIGLGADVKLIGGLSVTGSVGYMHFSGKKIDGNKMPAIAAVPVRVGLRLKFLPIIYVKFESGVANFTGKTDGSAVIIAPGIGLRIIGLDAEVKYEAWAHDGTLGFWGLKVGYNF
jgi:hypothetical protein